MDLNLFPHCQCCGEVPEKGLYDGIRVNGILFCRTCSQKVISSMPSEPFYEQFYLTLKKSLFSKHPTKQTGNHCKAWSTIKGIKSSNE